MTEVIDSGGNNRCHIMSLLQRKSRSHAQDKQKAKAVEAAEKEAQLLSETDGTSCPFAPRATVYHRYVYAH